ncbi:tlde1 domain-containing protein [Eleftheria terrae]|uniref:tlde1 domain-containing protein n=1 Tax=Eleftheria terrae TaxID=1597781 RepID=UPI00263A86C0|nr:tlde1 domain-containing protein [Eleftheria terrae]WKB55892.1 DUF2778 domain-containing protein [Eleftheria terrae]
MSDYTEERARPAVPHCARATMSLRFNGTYLTLSGKKTRVFPAVSGKPDQNGKFAYSADRQKVAFAGPIPEGEYWINFEELWTNAFWRRGSYRAWGNYRLTIHPLPSTKTHNRGGFFIHGGAVPGSAGCIDLNAKIDDFVAALREELGDSKSCYIPLSVAY